MPALSILIAILMLSGTSAAQDLHFKAVVGLDGNIELVPDPVSKGVTDVTNAARKSAVGAAAPDAAAKALATAIGTADAQAVAADAVVALDYDQLKAKLQEGLLVQKSPTGAIEALYPGAQLPPGILDRVEPGTTFLKAGGWSPFPAVDSDSLTQMQQTASLAAKQMFKAAMDTACSFDPLPRTISPTVEVSFHLFAGGSFSVQAEWETADICKDKGAPAAP